MELLEGVEEWLRDLALAASGGQVSALNPEGEGFFRDVLGRWHIHPTDAARALVTVDEARALASGNVNPQLVIFDLLHDLRQALTGRRDLTLARK